MAENAIKFTEDEIKKINDLRVEVSGLFTQLGQISIEKARRLKELEDAELTLMTRHQELVDSEQELFKTLNEKYGDGNYNPETGEFTPIEKSEEDQKPASNLTKA